MKNQAKRPFARRMFAARAPVNITPSAHRGGIRCHVFLDPSAYRMVVGETHDERLVDELVFALAQGLRSPVVRSPLRFGYYSNRLHGWRELQFSATFPAAATILVTPVSPS